MIYNKKFKTGLNRSWQCNNNDIVLCRGVISVARLLEKIALPRQCILFPNREWAKKLVKYFLQMFENWIQPSLHRYLKNCTRSRQIALIEDQGLTAVHPKLKKIFSRMAFDVVVAL